MKFVKTMVVAGAFLSLVGCQSTSDEPKQLEQTNSEAQKETSFAAYEKAKSDYESWLTKLQDAVSLKIYSKDLYKKMLVEWDDAVDVYEDIAKDPSVTTKSYSVFSSGTYIEHFEKYLNGVEENYTKLQELKVVADEVLGDAQAQMRYLDEIGAGKVYPSDYKKLASQYSDLFEDVEDGDIDDAQSGQVKFLNSAKMLEEKVVLKQYIEPLKKELAELRRQDFNDVAPISYAKTKAEIAAAEQTVRANTRDVEVIKLAVQDAQFELDHVKSVALEVKKLASVEDDKFESFVLEFENKLLKLSKALSNSDYRDNSLREQAEHILSDANEINSELEVSRLNHEESVNLLSDENKELKLKVKQESDKLTQAQSEKSMVMMQLEQSQSQISNLESLLEAYKSKLVAAEAKPESEKETVIEQETVVEDVAGDGPGTVAEEVVTES
ncbi:hypothetical protein L3Q72_08815 [Vibrio sp. JC009]|uniref:hypothetical protein n=1 Tax=Vibrio sp. JC009 TaxID=2912314 RepID=UPI0023B1A2B3|nr:hypothetical protein [Vibrio sp. JC009]WED20745.1 hypothetical protein L3Q72_08815 [Vibrio sp. JC009]